MSHEFLCGQKFQFFLIQRNALLSTPQHQFKLGFTTEKKIGSSIVKFYALFKIGGDAMIFVNEPDNQLGNIY